MKTAHEGMGVSDADFDAVATHLVETLRAAGVPDLLVGEIVARVGPLRSDIVSQRR